MTMPNDKNPREVNPRDENSREANPRDQNHRDKDHGDHTPEPTRGDRLDTLLRAWHDENREGARAMRDEILAQLVELLARGQGI